MLSPQSTFPWVCSVEPTLTPQLSWRSLTFGTQSWKTLDKSRLAFFKKQLLSLEREKTQWLPLVATGFKVEIL